MRSIRPLLYLWMGSIGTILLGQNLQLGDIKKSVTAITENINAADQQFRILDTAIDNLDYKACRNTLTLLRQTAWGEAPSSSLKSNIADLTHHTEAAYQELTRHALRDVVTKTDWIQLKEDYAEIRDSVKMIITKLRDIQKKIAAIGLTAQAKIKEKKELEGKALEFITAFVMKRTASTRDSLYQELVLQLERLGLTIEDVRFLSRWDQLEKNVRYDSLIVLTGKLADHWLRQETAEVFAEVLRMASDLQDKKITLDEVYTLANNRMIEKLEEEIGGTALAKAAADEFSVPKVEVLQVTLNHPEEVFLQPISGEQRYILYKEKIYRYDKHKTEYTYIQAVDARLENFELRFQPVIVKARINGDPKPAADTLYINTVYLKFYHYVDQLADKLTSYLRPIVMDKTSAGKVNYDDEKNNLVFEPDIRPTRSRFIGVAQTSSNGNNYEAPSVYTNQTDAALYLKNLFRVELIADDYESNRLCDEKWTMIRHQPIRINAYGPASWMIATIEPSKNIGGDGQVTRVNSRNTAQIKVNFEGTLVDQRFESAGGKFLYLIPHGPMRWIRYLKAGFVLNWKGDLERIDSLRGATVKEKLIDLYSENSESMLYFTFPVLSQLSRGRSYVMDWLVIRPMVYHERFKVQDAAGTYRAYDKLTGGLQVRLLDAQHFGRYNWRLMGGVDYRASSYYVQSEAVHTKSHYDRIGGRLSYFGELQPYNHTELYGKIGIVNMPGASQRYWMMYVSLNYRLNPLDVIAMTKKIIVPGGE